MYVQFHTNTGGGGLTLSNGVATGTVGGSQAGYPCRAPLGRHAGREAADRLLEQLERRVLLLSCNYPCGSCSVGRFAVDEYQVTVPGPWAVAVHVIDALGSSDSPATVASLSDATVDPSGAEHGRHRRERRARRQAELRGRFERHGRRVPERHADLRHPGRRLGTPRRLRRARGERRLVQRHGGRAVRSMRRDHHRRLGARGSPATRSCSTSAPPRRMRRHRRHERLSRQPARWRLGQRQRRSGGSNGSGFERGRFWRVLVRLDRRRPAFEQRGARWRKRRGRGTSARARAAAAACSPARAARRDCCSLSSCSRSPARSCAGVVVADVTASRFLPHLPGVPPPPQVCGAVQLPHCRTPPHPSPAGPHSRPSFWQVVGTHLPASG